MSDTHQYRAGRYVQQPGGYRAFIPKKLPPEPALNLDPRMQVLLSEADRAIGRLDAATELLPNPDLFVMMYVRKEAVDSSRIEGTQASLTDLLEFEAELRRGSTPPDVAEVSNYVTALNYGLERLTELPVSLRLMREIHAKLLHRVRGAERDPGEFRSSQNWIGSSGGLDSAVFVPPPPAELLTALGELEGFLHDKTPMQPLIKCGLAHAQFETIHPFLDGNGRMGRLLIAFLLCSWGVLRRPLLYISDYFGRNRQQYYDRLQTVRDNGDWEGWMAFFLQGVKSVSTQAARTAGLIQLMREEHRQLVGGRISGTAIGLSLLDHMFAAPMVTVKLAAQVIGRSYTTANSLVSSFEELGLLREVTGAGRNRVYAYGPYLDLFETSPSAGSPPVDSAEPR